MRRAISRFLVIALLFSQLALSAYACPLPANAPMAASAPEMDCCDGMPSSPLCGATCAQGAQAQDRGHPAQIASPVSWVMVSRAAMPVAMRPAPSPAHPVRALRPPGPEPSLHSRLRI